MSADREKWISIMIVPEDGAGMRKWRVTSRRYAWFKVGFWFMCFFLIVGFGSMVSVAVLYGRLHHYKQINRRLIEATSKLDEIAKRLESYEEKERKLRAVLGSDLDLPGPVTVAPDASRPRSAAESAPGGGDELEQAIAKEEARLRRIPTMWPVDAWQITKKFRDTGNPQVDHYGIDVLAPDNAGIVAAADGTVTYAGVDSRFGLLVVMDHGNGWETRYGHLGSLLVKSGDEVQKGGLIALFGESDGSSTGAHLHFGVFYKGEPVDPLNSLEERPLLNLAENGL